jgi:hypothetical protein
MGRSSKESWLSGPGDLKEADVEDVPVEGESVRVRGLPAAYSRDVISGCVEPQFTVEEADAVAQRYGPAFEKVVSKVDELSGVDKEGIEEAQARFQSSGNGATDEGEAGDIAAPVGGSGPDLPS